VCMAGVILEGERMNEWDFGEIIWLMDFKYLCEIE
jgi:hypothetical protein